MTEVNQCQKEKSHFLWNLYIYDLTDLFVVHDIDFRWNPIPDCILRIYEKLRTM